MAAKKQTKKTAKKIKLTFAPLVSAARELTIDLKKTEYQEKAGKQVPVKVPLIDGLPLHLVVRKNEIIEVTEKQFKELQEIKCVESDEEYQKRQEFIDNIGTQHPETLTFKQLASENYGALTPKESEYIYTDKLIRVD